MMSRVSDERIAAAAIVLTWVALLVTLPVWIVPAVVWMISTGRTPRSCGHEANRASGMEP